MLPELLATEPAQAFLHRAHSLAVIRDPEIPLAIDLSHKPRNRIAPIIQRQFPEPIRQRRQAFPQSHLFFPASAASSNPAICSRSLALSRSAASARNRNLTASAKDSFAIRSAA